jgi:hypothetical protein
MDHDENVVDARMAGEGGDGAGEHRRAADRPILLGAAGAGGRPGPSARRDDQSSHTHGDILMNKKKTNNIICLLSAAKRLLPRSKMANILILPKERSWNFLA